MTSAKVIALHSMAPRHSMAPLQSTMVPLLELRGITKQFPGVRALDNVGLEIRAGEVHGLVGENGAGKSTLIKILGGVHPAGSYQGDILVEGAKRRFASVAEARAAGVAIVHQELCLVPEMTVAENLLLGAEPTRLGIVDSARMVRDARAMLSEFGPAGQAIDPEMLVERLGVGEQQIVEIARALGTDARVVVLDEPTAALTDREAASLFAIVRTQLERGVAFVYISHRLEEIFELCDCITVLRDGALVGSQPTSELDTDQLVAMMTGAALASSNHEAARAPGDTVLHVEHLSVAHPTVPGRQIVDDVSIQLREGEVVALAGAMGAGRTALLSTLFGALRGGSRGSVRGRISVSGSTVQLNSPRDAIAAGIALVPEDRKGAGLVLEMTVGENMSLSALGQFCRAGVIDRGRESSHVLDQARKLAVKAASLDVEVATLSGGNQQKVVIGKWLLTEPRVLLLDEPTRGVDVGAKAEIYRVIRQLAEAGLAVLMASSDLPEIALLADRVIVLREGAVAGELNRHEASEESIMQLAVGSAGAVAQDASGQGGHSHGAT